TLNRLKHLSAVVTINPVLSAVSDNRVAGLEQAVLSLNRNVPDRDRLDLPYRHAGPLPPRLNLDARRVAIHRERVEPFSHERHSRAAAVAGPRVLSESLRRQQS